MKRVLFDSDVLLDILAQRQPFVEASAKALNTVTKGQIQGYVAGHAVTNIFYILHRQVGSEAAQKLIFELLSAVIYDSALGSSQQFISYHRKQYFRK